MRSVIRQVLLGGVCGLSSVPVMAQTPASGVDGTVTPAPQEPAEGAASEGRPASGADIVVTGTRITRDGYTAPTPVTVATTEDLVRVTPSSLPDGLNKLPQFANSSSPSRSSLNFANTPTHGNILNLRGVGPLRTLILFDGIRVPATTYVGTVDVNVLPQLLIQRIDTVTGGASAAYGSDAVSGVVNFVLNKKFTGVTGVAQAGVAQRGDNGNQRLGLAYGADFADDRGHVLLSGEYYNSDGMLRNQRASGRTGYTYVGATPGCVNTTTDATACQPGGQLNPYIAAADARLLASTPYGRIASSSIAGNPFVGQVFDPNGSVRPFQNGQATGSAFQLGGDGYTIPSNTSAVAPLTTYQAFGRASYEIADDLEVYVQGVFSRSDLSYVSLTNGNNTTSPATIYRDNPYLPDSIRATLPNATDFITVNSLLQFGPLPRTKERTDFYLGTVGVEGKISDRFTAQLAYTYGESRFDAAQSGLYDQRKTYAALDVVTNPANGQPTCRVLLDPAYASAFAGCQPLNVMGDPTVLTPAGYAYATGTSAYSATTKQNSIVGSISGDLFDLPAGAVSIAIGAEYRDQKLDLTSNADPALIDTAAERNAYFAGLRGVPAGASIFYLTNVGSAKGKLNVKEAFAELAVPVFKDSPLGAALDLSAAGRITDYSTSGTVKTWKVGGTYKPIEDLLLRATYSRDIRAPNLFELFSGAQQSIGTLIDPVSGVNGVFSAVTAGNPDLKPEIGKTLTFGGVVSPRFLPGFTLSVDYFRLKITDQINTLTAQQILNNCVSLGSSAVECGFISRPSPTAFPTLIRIAPANIAFVDTRGIDVDASYRTRLGEGALSLRVYANYLDKYDTQQNGTAPIISYAGKSLVNSTPTGYPRWRGSLTVDYAIGNFGVTVFQQYIGKQTLFIPSAPSNFVDPTISPVWYTDLSLRYKVPTAGGGVEFFGTVNNLFDKRPPLIPGTTVAVNLPTNIALYDQVQRSFTAGVRFTF